MSDTQGLVYLVGAGPGDPGLLTVRGLACLRKAEVVVYDGLVATELLAHVPASCERIYAGKKHSKAGSPLRQEDINALLIAKASAGLKVVRLKGGDPFVFGRGSEECLALRAAGIAFEVVPGVSAATAVPAYAGIPLTARGLSASAVLVTGHEASEKAEGQVDWKAVAGNHSIVLFMAWKKVGECVAKLLEAGCASNTPAAAIRWGTTARQRCVVSTLAELPALVGGEGMKPPMLVIIGKVVALREELDWFSRRPLFGRRIWVTRSGERALESLECLRELGARPIAAATTEICQPNQEQAQALRDSLANAHRFDWIFYTSATAVHACAKLLDGLGLDARALAGVRIAAVGRATHDALAEHGLRADLVGQGGNGGSLAEELVASSLGQVLRVLFPRAASGREEAMTILRAAGYEVELRAAYSSETRRASEPDLALPLQLLRKGELDAAAFFAPSQVEALCEIEPRASEYLAKLPVLAAIGKTTASALRDLGLRVHACADQPTSEDLASAIAKAFS